MVNVAQKQAVSEEEASPQNRHLRGNDHVRYAEEAVRHGASGASQEERRAVSEKLSDSGER